MNKTKKRKVRKVLSISDDRLEQIFKLQAKLNRLAGVDVSMLTSAERKEWMMRFVLAMHQELAELTETLPYKWWRKRRRRNAHDARQEIVDLLHFVVSLSQLSGMDAQQLYDLYVRKNRTNIARQKTRDIAPG
jgi:dimeric dUTPase (all-alpha-NTP-PPase superfamily)